MLYKVELFTVLFTVLSCAVVLFSMLFKVVLASEYGNETPIIYVITEEKNTDPYFPFIGLSCVNNAENLFKVRDTLKKRSLE